MFNPRLFYPRRVSDLCSFDAHHSSAPATPFFSAVRSRRAPDMIIFAVFRPEFPLDEMPFRHPKSYSFV